jgi:hypothetical protein
MGCYKCTAASTCTEELRTCRAWELGSSACCLWCNKFRATPTQGELLLVLPELQLEASCEMLICTLKRLHAMHLSQSLFDVRTRHKNTATNEFRHPQTRTVHVSVIPASSLTDAKPRDVTLELAHKPSCATSACCLNGMNLANLPYSCFVTAASLHHTFKVTCSATLQKHHLLTTTRVVLRELLWIAPALPLHRSTYISIKVLTVLSIGSLCDDDEQELANCKDRCRSSSAVDSMHASYFSAEDLPLAGENQNPPHFNHSVWHNVGADARCGTPQRQLLAPSASALKRDIAFRPHSRRSEAQHKRSSIVA